MSDKLPPEFDLSNFGYSALVGVRTVGDALAQLQPCYLPTILRVVWARKALEEGHVPGANVPSDMLLDDMRQYVLRKLIVVLFQTNGGTVIHFS